MKKTFNFYKYNKNHPLSIEIGRYCNGTLAIRAYTNEEGYPEPWSNITVNLNEELEKMTAFIDTENNGNEIVKTLIENGFGELTGRAYEYPYCTFPEFKFYPEKLKEFDSDGFEEYDAYADALAMLKE